MRLSLASAATLLLVVVSTFACTLWPGQGWGEATVSLSARFAPDDTRLTAEGYLKTSRDYAVDISGMSLDVDAVELVVVNPDAAATALFDPATPPAGYSLCHGGHCHAEDGRLVEYADIEAELGGGSTQLAVAVLGATEAVTLTAEPAAIALGDCTAGCILPRGEVQLARVRLAAISLTGTLLDLRDEANARLPPEGVPLFGTVSLDVPLEAAVGVQLDGSEAPGVALDLLIDITPTLLDRIGLAFFVEEGVLDLAAPPGFVASDVVLNIADDSSVVVEVARFSPRPDEPPTFFPVEGNSGEQP